MTSFDNYENSLGSAGREFNIMIDKLRSLLRAKKISRSDYLRLFAMVLAKYYDDRDKNAAAANTAAITPPRSATEIQQNVVEEGCGESEANRTAA
jgi:hypothetical protein